MFAANADVFAPGDSFGIPTTSAKNRVPHLSYKLDRPSVLVGAAGLLVLLWLTRYLGRRKR